MPSPEGLIFTGGIQSFGFDTTACVVRLTSLFRLVSVRASALEFCKATVVASDLTTGAPTSNRRPTVLQRRRAEGYPAAG